MAGGVTKDCRGCQPSAVVMGDQDRAPSFLGYGTPPLKVLMQALNCVILKHEESLINTERTPELDPQYG